MNAPLALKYWPVWLGVGLVRLLIYLPYRWQLWIGGQLGLLSFYFAKRARRIATLNIAKCFAHLSASEQNALIRASFMNLGIGALETAFGWWANPKRLRHLTKIAGLAHIQQIQATGQGVIICAAHMSSVHLVGRLINLVHPVAVMFFPPKHPVFRWISERALRRHYAQAIPRQATRALVQALRQGQAVFYTPDTDAGAKHSVFVPFCGVIAATLTATARFATLSQANVIIAKYGRRADNTGYDIEFDAPLRDYPSGDVKCDAQVINSALEVGIRQFPAQYLWQYKRFKTRPIGEAKFY